MTGFPDVLLSEVLDYFGLHELLFSAMPVNRFWRSSAIEHPCYWKRISLDQESTHERRVHSTDLFFLRLARAGTKPVDLRIWMKDPAAVLDTLAREIHHIRSLTMCIEVTHSLSLFLSVRDTPAPILESLWLTLNDETSSQAPGPVPEALFALETPVLTSVSFYNVTLPPGELPAWLANADITTFIYSSSLLDPQLQHLPNIFASWPRLQILTLGGIIDLTDPAFLQAGTWAGLDYLGLSGGLIRRIPALQLAHIPRICISETYLLSADELVFISNVLMNSGPLEVTLSTHPYHHPDPAIALPVELNVVLKCMPDAGKWRGRWIGGYLPPNAPGSHPESMITGFQHGPLVPRIVSLCISLDSWDMLVGRGYLAQFPAVEDLALTLEHWFHGWNETWRAPAHASKLELPRLRRIVFRYEHYGPAYLKPVLQLANLAEFTTSQLSGVRLPLLLALEGVDCEGAPEEFAEVLKI